MYRGTPSWETAWQFPVSSHLGLPLRRQFRARQRWSPLWSIGAAIAAFWLGLLLILLLTGQRGRPPAIGAETTAHGVLPAMTPGFGVAEPCARIIRSGILEARGQPFLPAFHLRGIAQRDIARDQVAVLLSRCLGWSLPFCWRAWS